MNTARTNILNRLKAAQEQRGETGIESPDFTSPVYHPLGNPLKEDFKTNLEAVGGQAIFLESPDEIPAQVKKICQEKNQDQVFCTDPKLREILGDSILIESGEQNFFGLNIGVTGCEFLVAHLGSVLISSAQISGRRLNVFPETHIVVANESQIAGYLDEAIEKLQLKYKNNLPSLISTITGPSRTADIEKTLVMGMHGPKSLIVLISA